MTKCIPFLVVVIIAPTLLISGCVNQTEEVTWRALGWVEVKPPVVPNRSWDVFDQQCPHVDVDVYSVAAGQIEWQTVFVSFLYHTPDFLKHQVTVDLRDGSGHHLLIQDEPASQLPDPVEAYVEQDMLGWTLRVHEDLLAEDELAEQTLAEVYHQLYRITRIMPEDKLEHLREVVLWIELENPQGGTACYHPNRQWLENNHHLPDKERGIEIGNARSFLQYTLRSQPFVLLHELSHAYHHRVLGFDEPTIRAHYERIVEAGIYEEVLSITGREGVRHYALTDHKEYFAESTEAFFGQNDFYPFVQGELYVYDRETYDMMVEIWGIEPGH